MINDRIKKPIWEGHRWRIRVYLDGKRYSFSSSIPGNRGKADCREKYEAWLEGHQYDGNVRVEIAYERFLERQRAKLGPDAPSVRQCEQIGSCYILPVIGSRRVYLLTQDCWQSVINKARPTRIQGKERLSKKTLMNIRATLSQFNKFCVARGYCDALREDLYIPAGAPVNDKPVLTPENLRDLFTCDPIWLTRFFRFDAVTGLRPGECMGLQWSDIDFVTRRIVIRRSINVQNKVTEGKNKNAQRTFILSDVAFQILQEQKEATEYLKSEWVFCSQIGGPISHNGVYRSYRRHADKLGLPGTPYTLRHTFVSFMKNDVPLTLLKSVVGHSEEFDTLGTYGHKVDGEDEKAAAIIDNTLSNLLYS